MRIPLSATLVALLALGAFAQSAPRIVVSGHGGDGKEGVSLAEVSASGSGATIFLNVLKADLSRSGWFSVVDGAYAGVRVRGSVRGDGAASTQIQVSWPGGSFPWSEASQGVGAIRWQAHRLSDEIVRRVKGKPGMAASRIAFIGKEGASASDVYLCDSDGQGFLRLTQDRVPALSPYFHPNGQSVFYTSFKKGFACVYRVPTAGGRREPFANFTGLNTGGAVSPDGSYIAVILSHPGNPELFVINLSSRRAIRQTFTPRAAEASPCWSPDGKRIAYVSDATGTPQIYIFDSNTKKSQRVSFQGSQNVAPSWGPDGRLAYCSKQGGYQIVVYDPRTGNSKTVSSGADHEDPSWAPDGRHIVCSRKEGARGALYVLDTEGDHPDPPVRLPLPAGDWRAPECSPSLRH